MIDQVKSTKPTAKPKVVPKVKQVIKLNAAKGFTKNLQRTMLVRHNAKLKTETDTLVVYEGPDVIIEVTLR